jgi:hypothetical protein
MELNSILTVVSSLLGLAGFTEWRIRTVETRLLEKMKDREDVTKVKVDELKSNLARLEAKIDMILKLQIQRDNHDAA